MVFAPCGFYSSPLAGAFGLVAVDAFEDRSSSLEISNRAADEFRKLRDEVVAERAARILPNQMPKETS
jgi:hypothetical protein